MLPSQSTRTSAPTPFAGTRHLTGEHYLLALSVAIPALYAMLFAVLWDRIGPRDFSQALVFHELQYWNQQLFGFAKQWSPVFCSGLSLAGEPQIPFLSLSMALGYVLGPLAGLKVAALAYLACGWAGTYLYARLWTDDRRIGVLAASLFIGNGFFILRLAVGHVDFTPVLTLPIMLWLLHHSLLRPPGATPFALALRTILLTLVMAAGISLTIDGAPVSFIHLQFWIGLYALVLAVVARTPRPAAVFAAAAVLACLLDAGYVWPMVVAQGEFPRHVPDAFTNPLAFLWFLLLPVQGKAITPANGNGHELSVFVGPVIAYLTWRYRRGLLAELPGTVKYPLLVVSVVSLWLGMGSLRAIHVPITLSPFDWLRPLPGFRSMGVTGRYWGFLALPLSLLGAAALYRFVGERRSSPRFHTVLTFALLLQLGFQATAILLDWLPTPHFSGRSTAYFSRNGETIRFGYCHSSLQANSISPRHGIIDCYDMDDFRRARMEPGTNLIQSVEGASATDLRARFVTWDRIRIGESAAVPIAAASPAGRIQIVLNQAYHRDWQSRSCQVGMNPQGNMVLNCDPSQLARQPIELDFTDPVSDLGAKVSATTWAAWLLAMACVLALIRRRAVRDEPSPSMVPAGAGLPDPDLALPRSAVYPVE